MANEFVIKNGYFSQGNSNVTGSLSVTQNVTASKALFSSSGVNQLMVIGSGSSSWLTGIYGSQGNIFTATDTMSGSLFTVADISGYPIFKVISDHYTNSIQMIGTASLTGSLSITENLSVGQNVTASKVLISSSGNEQLIVMGSGSSSWITGIYGSQGNLLTVTDTFSGSIFTVTDISGYPILDITSDYYTSSINTVGFLNHTGSAGITGSLIISGGFITYNTSPGYKAIDSTLSNLYYSDGDVSIDWANSLLKDTDNTTSINWDTRLLIANNNSTVHIDWDNPAYIKFPNVNTSVPIVSVLGLDGNGNLYATASTAFGGGNGSGTPGGSNRQIQFNANGTFSGSSNFTFDSSSNTVNITGSLIVSNGITGSLLGTATNATDATNASYIFVSENQPNNYPWTIPVIEGGGGGNSLLSAVGPSKNTSTANWLFAGGIEASGFFPNAGSNTVPPIKLTAGTNLTTPEAGAIEYDGTTFYHTNDTTSGRGYEPSIQIFRLAANGSSITTIANFFGPTSSIQLAAGGKYEIEAYCYFSKLTTNSTVVVTITTSAAPVNLNAILQYGLLTNGGLAGAANQVALFGSTSTSSPLTSGTLTATQNHAFTLRLILDANASASNLRINFTSTAGSVTPLRNSYYKVTRLPGSNVGNFVA